MDFIENKFFQTRFIFLYYAPGTFGSTLYHILHNTKECQKYFKIKNNQVFDKDKTAHSNIIEPINGLHDFLDVIPWLNLSDNEKKLYLIKNLNPKVNFNKVQPPTRLAHYEGFVDLKNFFKKSSNIFISFEEKYFDFLVEILKEKLHPEKDIKYFLPTTHQFLFNKTKSNQAKNQIITSCLKESFEYFYNSYQNIKECEKDFSFPFHNFFEYDLFKNTIENLLKTLSLNFEDDFDIENFYDYFYKTNKVFIEMALKIK